jgi:ABC-type antimicrobial peptide transport system permease subunit
MHAQDLISSSLQSLGRNKGRSVLTMLGIIIGVMSVILVLSIGEAAQRQILGQISAFGSDLLFVRNGPVQSTGQPQQFPKESLTYADVKKLQTEPWASIVVGKVMQQDQITALGISTSAQIVGTSQDELRITTTPVAQGTFLTQPMVDEHARVAVLGSKIAQAAFGSENPVGQYIKADNVQFKVIGVMASAGSSGFLDPDREVIVPVTAALDLYNKKYLTFIQLKTTFTDLNQGKERVAAALRDRHNIDNPTGDPTKDDFNLVTQEDIVKTAGSVTGILQVLLTSIAAISLLVGGIGIMNIMYVSVTERIREIGLRKSIGAHRGDILSQFLVEAIVQTMIGGMIGITLGIVLSFIGISIIAQFQEGWKFGVSTNGVLLGLGVSAAIGIVFGYFPARSAANLSPMDALRRE